MPRLTLYREYLIDVREIVRTAMLALGFPVVRFAILDGKTDGLEAEPAVHIVYCPGQNLPFFPIPDRIKEIQLNV